MRYLRPRKADRESGATYVCTAVDVDIVGERATLRRIADHTETGPQVTVCPRQWLNDIFDMAWLQPVVVILKDAVTTEAPSALALIDLASLLDARPDWRVSGSPVLSPGVTMLRFESPESENSRAVTIVGGWQMFPRVQFEDDAVTAAAHMSRLLTERRRMVKDWQMGGVATTPAAQALRVLQRRLEPRTMVVTSTTEEKQPHQVEQLLLSSLAVSGGRRHASVGVHVGDFHNVDFDSCYARLLSSLTYPIRPGTSIKATPDEMQTWIDDGDGVIAAVKIRPRVPAFAVRPVVGRNLDSDGYVNTDYEVDGRPMADVDDVTTYPSSGSHWSILTTRELQRAQRGDLDILEVGHCWTFTMSSEPWHSFAKTMLEMTEYYRGTEHEAFCKTTRNFLWGKLSQSYLVYDLLDDEEVPRWAKDTFDGYGRVFNRWMKPGVRKVGVDTFPAAGAHLVADARLAMFDLMDHVGLGNVQYVHTDGLWTSSEGFERMGSYAGLPWKVKGSTKILKVHENGGYSSGTGRAMPGIPRRAQRVGQDQWSWVEWDPYSGERTRGKVYGRTITIRA